jgi:hypothetical protein
MATTTRDEMLATLHRLRGPARESFRAMAGRPYPEPAHLFADLLCEHQRVNPLDAVLSRMLAARGAGRPLVAVAQPGKFLVDVAASWYAADELPSLPDAVLAQQAVQGEADLHEMRVLRSPCVESRERLIEWADRHIVALQVMRDRAARDNHDAMRERHVARGRLAAGA